MEWYIGGQISVLRYFFTLSFDEIGVKVAMKHKSMGRHVNFLFSMENIPFR